MARHGGTRLLAQSQWEAEAEEYKASLGYIAFSVFKGALRICI